MPPKGFHRASPAPHVAIQPPPPSPIVLKLRQDWKFAALSQFLALFYTQAFGTVVWDPAELEADFDGSEQNVIPPLMTRMLYTLTLDRRVDQTNWVDHLRKQYLRRSPEENKLGTKEEPRQWEELGLGDKVAAMHQLCEWHLMDPTRFRGMLHTEEDAASWRIDPVGWDKNNNTYWLFDDNRLWVQHPGPNPMRPTKGITSRRKSLKAKASRKQAAAEKKAETSTAAVSAATTATVTASPSKSHAKKPPLSQKEQSPMGAPLGSSDPMITGPRKRKQPEVYGQVVKKPRATRTSSRINSSDVWQEIPPEWLSPNGADEAAAVAASQSDMQVDPTSPSPAAPSPFPSGAPITSSSKQNAPISNEWTGLGDDSGSELSEIDTDAVPEVEAEELEVEDGGPLFKEDPEEEVLAIQDDSEDEDYDENEDDDEDEDEQELPFYPLIDHVQEALENEKAQGEFLEWEAVCVSRWEWEQFPEKFANSSHADEKALYRVLTEDIIPRVVIALGEIEQMKQAQIAIAQRKRSHRIAILESERAEIDRASNSMETRRDRARMEEARQAKEDEENGIVKESARDARIREREEKMFQREAELAEQLSKEQAEEEEEEEKKAQALSRADRSKKRETGWQSFHEEVDVKPSKSKKAVAVKTEPVASTSTIPVLHSSKSKKLSYDTKPFIVDKKPAPVRKSLEKAVKAAAPPPPKKLGKGAGKVTVAASADDWEVDCEVCGVSGRNLDDGTEMASCEGCSKWQHIACHNKVDALHGKQPRKWQTTEFKCTACKKRDARNQERRLKHAADKAAAAANVNGSVAPSSSPAKPNSAVKSTAPSSSTFKPKDPVAPAPSQFSPLLAQQAPYSNGSQPFVQLAAAPLSRPMNGAYPPQPPQMYPTYQLQHLPQPNGHPPAQQQHAYLPPSSDQQPPVGAAVFGKGILIPPNSLQVPVPLSFAPPTEPEESLPAVGGASS